MRTQCANQLKNLTLGMLSYETVHRKFPPGYTDPGMAMWSTFLLPHIELNNLYKTIDVKATWVAATTTNPGNITALGTELEIFLCPSASLEPAQYDPAMDADRVYSCYLACASGLLDRESGDLPWCGMNVWEDFPASDGIFYRGSETRQAWISDGMSHTLLIGETLPDQFIVADDYSANPQKVDHWILGSAELGWDFSLAYGSGEASECLGSTACRLNAIRIDEAPINEKELGFGSAHANGVNFGFADGHVQFVTDIIDSRVLSALGTRSGGETDHNIE